MSNKNIEIEFKNMVNREEFSSLIDFFNIRSEDFSEQENHYFDTPDFLLKAKGSALRIREKNGSFELTLKQPHPEGLLETNENLTESEAAEMIRTGKIPAELIIRSIKELGIETDKLQYFGTLATKRAEKEYMKGLAVLDHSRYLNKEDFELEYEVDNRNEGELTFLNLLKQLNIPVRKTENKIKRFYNEKYRQQKD
ncbi:MULTISPECIES: CYTH domain-containing protein [Cytobacillus]|uniref:CYTH domain-containing protein n=3 Tax=Cytobacillus TaxID=2675230 RepID=A0A160M9Y5_9BACI|nr:MULTISPECIES: CYTH domain-containing protein [Cytobacillus]EFV79080.1 adenylate cyclase [Bacillus sp. 2_A_57_CT2]MBY0156979.1 CYTH domain-containing protein [Cytobacillus firmus]AND38988.1 CYTH domain-containing protein [Cytobacillus oceanisediminis 2691]MBU8733364.1 CYTH domain-containing protein [Cytobacillus oceanisediminis]MCM3392010.1 CYTH domain-containing protein [Cytobacillus oceanisediminis]